jgi:hypothetical protein
VLLRDDVIDLERKGIEGLQHAAIFARPVGTAPHLFSELLVHSNYEAGRYPSVSGVRSIGGSQSRADPNVILKLLILVWGDCLAFAVRLFMSSMSSVENLSRKK